VGVGTLGIVDDDTVSLSNLQRQIIHDTESIGTAKTESAKRSVTRINPHVRVEKHTLRLDDSNAASILSAYDILVDGSDNFTTRYLLADMAEKAHKPLVSGAIGRFDGSITVLKPYEYENPGYRDLFPESPPGTVPACAEAGVIGALQAMEVIKLITGIGEPLVGRIVLYDGLDARFDTIRYKKAPGKIMSPGRTGHAMQATLHDNIHSSFCARESRRQKQAMADIRSRQSTLSGSGLFFTG